MGFDLVIVGHNRACKGFDDPCQPRYLFFDRHISIMPSIHRASLSAILSQVISCETSSAY